MLRPDGRPGQADGHPRVGLKLLGGWPKKVRCQTALVNFTGAAQVRECSTVFVENSNSLTLVFNDLTLAGFRDPTAGWVVRGRAAPFVRVLEVSDPTAEEVAAEEAAAARRNA